MLDKNLAFEEAIRYFPRWMDIRKRKEKSEGGKLLRSITDEIGGLQEAQENYRKEFFILHYIGREDEIIDYLYSALIGGSDKDEILLINPSIKVTREMKEFIKDKSLAFYGEGKLFLREAPSGVNQIKYSVNGFSYDAIIKKEHIWNVFDEFALFSGLERYEEEKNEALLKRTLMAFKRRENSTEDGLKNAIMNALVGIDDLEREEISIAKTSEKDLFEEDETFGDVIEKLAQINRDTYRTKVWDKNRWEHAFKKLSYAPIPWDEEIEKVQDGVVGIDSLRPHFISELEEADSTDVSIDLYGKSSVTVNEYIRNRRVETSIDLKLKKYHNVIKPKEAEYKITAEQAIELGKEDIYIDAHRIFSGEKDYYVSELLVNKDEVSGITNERGALLPNRKYRLRFTSPHEYGTMDISRANIVKTTGIETLLSPRGAYGFDASNQFSNLNVKLHSTSLSDFSEHENLTRTDRGIGLLNSAEKGYGIIDVSEYGGQYVRVESDVQETTITHNPTLVHIEGSLIRTEDNKIISNGRTGKITIATKCNRLSYRMAEGNAYVTKTINGVTSASEIWSGEKSESLRFDKETDVVIEIEKANNSTQLVVDNIKYARYDVQFRLEKNNLIRTPMGAIIPNLNGEKDNLIVEVNTFTGLSPVIKFIHIGASLKNAEYATELFNGADGSKLDVETNCDVALEIYDASNALIETIKPYVSKDFYVNNTSEAMYLEIDTSKFSNLKRTVPKLEKFSHQGRFSSWVKLLPGESLDTIKIDGNVKVTINRVRINELLKTSASDLIYSSRKMKGFVVKSGTKETYKTIKGKDLGAAADAYSVHGLPVGMRGAFVVDSESNIESLGTDHSLSFEKFYIISSPTEHIAYNKTRMFRDFVDNVDMVDMFTPLIPVNQHMIYHVEPGTGALEMTVQFMHSSESRPWSVGKRKLSISIDIDRFEKDNYESEEIELRKRVVLGNNIDLEEEQVVGQRILNLGEYIVIPPEDMGIIHEAKDQLNEVIYVNEDGFNKLRYSNVSQITKITRQSGATLSSYQYSLLKNEGIISWNNPSLYGERMVVSYKYGLPRFLTFKSQDKLYQAVGYSIDAYEYLDTIHMEGVSKDETLSDEYAQRIREADRIVSKSSNPNFIVNIDGAVLRIVKANEEDRVVMRGGFFHQHGQDYYKYVNRSENFLESMGSVDLVDTEREEGVLITNYSSSNFVPNSSMSKGRMAVLSVLDARKDLMTIGSGKTGRIGACDDYNYWRTMEMDISFIDGFRGKATAFTQRREYGFAMMDITDFLEEGSIVSLHASGSVEVFFSKADLMSDRNPYVSHGASEMIPMRKTGSLRSYKLEELESKRYFLVVKGTGAMDDILISKDMTDLEDRHKSTMDRIGISVQEKKIPLKSKTLYFDQRGNEESGLETSVDGLIRTASTVQWGLTKIYEAKSHWKNVSLRYASPMIDRYYYIEEDGGYVESEPIYLRSYISARRVIVSLNELVQGSMKNLSISIYASDRASGQYRHIQTSEGTNFIETSGQRLGNYFKIRVSGEKGKIISSLSVYAEYAEGGTPLRVGESSSGVMISKVYDLGAPSKIKVLGMSAENVEAPEKIRLSVRAKRIGYQDAVWTAWKEVEMSEELEAKNLVTFDGYEFIQYRILLESPAKLKLKTINLEEM